jgi:tetratricopeptide (TPR) repeat protein
VLPVITVVFILGPIGCSLFDWETNEMPVGYRASPMPARQAKLTARERGQANLRENRLGLAIDGFLTALVMEERSIETLNGLGVAYDLLGRYDLSRQYYREALSIDPQSVRTLNNLGRSYALEGSYIEAIRYYELATALDPSNKIVIANLVEVRAIALRPLQRVADASDPGAPRSAEPRLPWVQFAGLGAQSLVTRADDGLIESLRKSNVKPQLAAPESLVVDDERPGGSVPTVSPARHAGVAPEAADAARPQAVIRIAAREDRGHAIGQIPVATKVSASAVAEGVKSDPSKASEGPAMPPAAVLNRGAGRYRVQLAALRTNAEAEQARQTLRNAQSDILDRLELTIERADLGAERGVFYRIQTSPIVVEEDAKNLCRSFTQRRQNCFVVRT